MRSLPAVILLAGLIVLTTSPARATGLIRDADIEHSLTQLAAPVLRAAGLNPRRVKVLVVNDQAFNAFVIDNRTIFLNYGLILTVESPEMLQAVIAHEAAHIANGHIARRIGNLRNANLQSGLGLVLAALAAAAGSAEAGAGIAAGVQSSALRGFLSHTRAEESAADRSALNFMVLAGIDPQGMIDVHSLFAGQDFLSAANRDPYMLTHPLGAERVRAAERYVARQGDRFAPRAQDQYWLARTQGKISAFLRSPKWTLQRVQTEPETDITLMRRAVAYHQLRDFDQAEAYMQRALDLRPGDPYYLDLMGQIMMEHRQWDGALAAYAAAFERAPYDAQILGGYGKALLAMGRATEARDILAQARARDGRDVRIMHDLARAYAASGDEGLAALTTAERHALSGNMSDAARHARRAQQLLPRGSAAALRAQDLIPPQRTEP